MFDVYHSHMCFQDNSDSQYAGFRENIPYMAMLLCLHPLARKLYERMTNATTHAHADTLPKSQQAENRFKRRTSFDLYFAIIFLTALHGVSAAKILLILYINYNVALLLPKTMIVPSTWIFNVAILFANEFAHGYPLSSIAKMVIPESPLAMSWAQQLDSFGGLIPRWEVLFKFVILRQISFNTDYYWSLGEDRAGSPVEVCDPSRCLPSILQTGPDSHRRGSLIRLTSPSAIALLFQLQHQASRHSGHMLLISCIHHSFLLDRY